MKTATENHTKMQPQEWRAGISLAFVYALRMLGIFLMLPVLALYAAKLPDAANNKIMIGMAMGIYGLTQAALQLPLGMASDKFGRKKVIYAGLIVFALGSFMAAFAETLNMLVLARAVQGAGAISAAVTALLADLTRNEVRSRAIAIIGLSIGLTFSISLAVSPILNEWIGVKGLFVLTGILSIAGIAVVAWLTPKPIQSELHEDIQAQPSRIGEVLKDRKLIGLNFGIFALHTAQMALFTSLPFALVELGLLKSQHWKIYLPATVIGLIIMVPLIIIGETRNKLKQVFIGGIACIGIAQVSLLFGLHSAWLIGLFLILYFIGFNILEASLPSMVSKIAPSNLKGTAMGIYNTMQSVGLFAGGAVGGLLFQHYGFSSIFIFCSVLILLWLIIAIKMPALKPLKNLIFSLPESWRGNEECLYNRLSTLAGVEAVSFSTNKQTVFIKVCQNNFNQPAVEHIISEAGRQHKQ